MNKTLKILFMNVILVMSFLFNFQNNISYSQNKNNIDELSCIVKEENNLNKMIDNFQSILENEKNNSKAKNSYGIITKKININNLKLNQINLIEQYLKSKLNECITNKNMLIKKVRIEKQLQAKNENLAYIKGIWPLEDYHYISSQYGYRVHPITKRYNFHTGIDIPAPKNTPVLAVDDGIVIFAGYKKGYGNVVEIKHFDSKKTLYAHNNIIVVKYGDIVKKGQTISKVGSTGNSTGNHVHFEVKINNQRINPIYAVNKSK